MKLTEIEDQEKLKLLLKGNVLNKIDDFNAIKAKLRNKSVDYLMTNKSKIINLLSEFEESVIRAIMVLHDYKNDVEAEEIVSKYETLLGRIGFSKAQTNKNIFDWVKY
jgi:hypothetical protein